MHRKGQEAVSLLLMSGILIGVVGSVYFWGVPLIQKSRDAQLLENAEALMLLIDQKIKTVAASGGRETIKIVEPGTLRLIGGKISYNISTDGTIYAIDASIPLGKTGNCDDTKQGVLGQDDSSVLCVVSNQISSAKYQNTYTLSYRNLTSGLKIFRIVLIGPVAAGGAESSIIIENAGVIEATENGKQVVTVNIDIKIQRA
ncbi:MAG: hypothetical protein HY514_05265 [Candidatus Aenigmarchaeota archaeon]|nr:hypothetical protein [Candidatus Aenigmarchaeota archaeon]